jgi:hypothetical protein
VYSVLKEHAGDDNEPQLMRLFVVAQIQYTYTFMISGFGAAGLKQVQSFPQPLDNAGIRLFRC